MIASSTDRTINSDYIILFQNQFVNCQVFAYPIIKSIYTHWTISDDVEVTTQINYPISMEICRKLRNVTKTCDEVKFISSMNMNEKKWERVVFLLPYILYNCAATGTVSILRRISLAIKKSSPLLFTISFSPKRFVFVMNGSKFRMDASLWFSSALFLPLLLSSQNFSYFPHLFQFYLHLMLLSKWNREHCGITARQSILTCNWKSNKRAISCESKEKERNVTHSELKSSKVI